MTSRGVHMQVTDIAGDVLSFDVIVETLRATNLGALQIGTPINFERSARVGDEIGGHNVSGHIATTATVASIVETPDNRTITFTVALLSFSCTLLLKGLALFKRYGKDDFPSNTA